MSVIIIINIIIIIIIIITIIMIIIIISEVTVITTIPPLIITVGDRMQSGDRIHRIALGQSIHSVAANALCRQRH